jgi:enterochelin esterase-like enzyme
MRLLTLLLLALTTLCTWGQPPRKLTRTPGYELKLDEASELILPPGYTRAKKYPLVIFLPFTGGTGGDLLARMLEDAGLADQVDASDRSGQVAGLLNALFEKQAAQKSFIVMIPPGRGSTKDHSSQGFEACIYRYENRILTDISEYRKRYNIDTTRMMLTGYSLGGDLSWAISQRYPEKFKGAIISGSSCGYAEKGMMARQAKQGVRYYLAMGQEEISRRTTGMAAARAQLDKAAVAYQYTRMPGSHVAATMEQFRNGLNYVLFR